MIFVWIQVLLLNYALKPLPQVMGGLRMWLSGAVEHTQSVTSDSMPAFTVGQHSNGDTPILTDRALEFRYLIICTYIHQVL